jgi:hypothetical protein
MLFPPHDDASADVDINDQISSLSIANNNRSRETTPSRAAIRLLKTHVNVNVIDEEERNNTSTSSSITTTSSSSLNDSANQSMTRARKAIDALKELSRAILPHPQHLSFNSSFPKTRQVLGEGSTSSLSVSWSTADGIGEEGRVGTTVDKNQSTAESNSAVEASRTRMNANDTEKDVLQTQFQTVANNDHYERDKNDGNNDGEGSSSLSFNVSDDGSSISVTADEEKEEEEEHRMMMDMIEEGVDQRESNRQVEMVKVDEKKKEEEQESGEGASTLEQETMTSSDVLPVTTTSTHSSIKESEEGHLIVESEEKEKMHILPTESSISATTPHRTSSSSSSLALLHHLSPISSIVDESLSTSSSSPAMNAFELKEHPETELLSKPTQLAQQAEEPQPVNPINNSGRFPLFSPTRNAGPIRALASQAPPQALAAAAAAAASVSDNKLLSLAALTSSPHVARRLHFFHEDPHPRLSSTAAAGGGGISGSPTSVRTFPLSNVAVNGLVPSLYTSSSSSQSQPLEGITSAQDLLSDNKPLSDDHNSVYESNGTLLSSESVFLSQTVSPNMALSIRREQEEIEVVRKSLSNGEAKEKLFAALDAAARLLPSLIPAPATTSSLNSKIVSPRSQKRSALHLIGRGLNPTSSVLSKPILDTVMIAKTPNPTDTVESATPSSAASDPGAPTPPFSIETDLSSESKQQAVSDEQFIKSVGIASPNVASRRSKTAMTSPSTTVLASSASPAQKSSAKPPRPSLTGNGGNGALSPPPLPSLPQGPPGQRNGRNVANTKVASSSSLRSKLNEFKAKPVERKLVFQSPVQQDKTRTAMMMRKVRTTTDVTPTREDPTKLLIL